MTLLLTDPRIPERFRDKVEVDELGCWRWRAHRNKDGYAQFKSAGRAHYAHRWIYEELVEKIPRYLTVDHLCEVHECVNPDHFEIVTREENAIRENLRRGEKTTPNRGVGRYEVFE